MMQLTRPGRLVLALFALVFLAGAPSLAVLEMVGKSGRPISAKPEKGVRVVSLKDGLKYQDLLVGKGPHPKAGQTVTVAYVGMLQNGMVFDASARHGHPLSFVLGRAPVIKGWDEGLRTMRVGGERKLFVPPSLGYGSAGAGPIPPNATLVFTIDLLKVR